MLRASVVGVGFGALLAAPLVAVVAAGLSPGQALAAVGTGLLGALETVGWVLAPQLALAVAVGGLALQQLTARGAGLPPVAAPRWLEPAVESALLLGMLGTISGMVAGFVSVTPETLEPGPLVNALGRALRSSFVGFGIALVGVWTRTGTASEQPS